jgi:putative ABC transport system permease protein
LKSRLLQNPLISAVSLTNTSVGEGLNNNSTFSFYAKGAKNAVSRENFYVHDDFLDVLQTQLKEERDFSSGLNLKSE